MECTFEDDALVTMGEQEMISCQGGIAPLVWAIVVLAGAAAGAYGAGFVWGRTISTKGDCPGDDDSSSE